MASGVIKLANKLPRINPPLALPNGDTNVPCFPDTPYVNGAVDVTGDTGQPAQILAEWLFPARKPTTKVYVYAEFEEVNGAFYFANMPSSPYIQYPGAYLIENNTGSILTYTRIVAAPSYFNADPTFKTLPVGYLPDSAGVTLGWCRGTASTYVYKDNNGKIRMNLNNSPGTVALFYKMDMPNGSYADVEFTIDYLPPGSSLRLGYYGGGTLDDFYYPGTYKYRAYWNSGYPVCLINTGPVQGEAIVSRFATKEQGQSWTVEGKLRAKTTAVWLAQYDVFDAVVNPSILVADNQFDHPMLAGMVPPSPQLGFNSYIPPAGMYRVGDTIYNRTAAAGQVSGWRCVAAGNPGIWAPLPVL